MNDLIINSIEILLERAVRGEITALAIAVCSPDLSTGSQYVIGDATLSELLGSVELLKFRILNNGDHEVA